MNQENTNKLYTAFPALYRSRVKPRQQLSMHFGFRCDDGWFDIIWELSNQLEEIARQSGIVSTDNEWLEVNAIKQKVGSLRMHLVRPQQGYRASIERAYN